MTSEFFLSSFMFAAGKVRSAAHPEVLGSCSVRNPPQPRPSHLPGSAPKGSRDELGGDICSGPTITGSCSSAKAPPANSYEVFPDPAV